MSVKYPHIAVTLHDNDNIVFAASDAGRAMKQAGVPREEIDAFYEEVNAQTSYGAAMRVIYETVNVS